MAEYIEREATIELYCQKCKGYYDGHCIHRGECDVDVIRTAPAADVQPVKRGHWEISSDGYYPYCSECGFRPKEISNFCPDCGAQMVNENDP